MKCPFCAENIRDAAVLCRFCGAARTTEDQWIASDRLSPPATRRKGSSTIKIAGAFYLLSSVVSITSLTSDVPLFGAMRSGGLALGYNLFYAILFLSVGLGLIIGRVWGYRLFLAGTIVYSLDGLAFLLNKNTRDAYLAASGVTRDVGTLVDLNMFDQGVVLASLVSLLCWWGFAVYVYLRRDYFRGSITLTNPSAA